MPSIVLNEFFVSALKGACEGDNQLEKTYRKVEAILRDYAERKKVAYKKLRVIDLIADGGEIQPPLLSYIRALPRLPGQSEERRKRYISEIASRIRRLMTAITGVNVKGRGVPATPVSILMGQVPEYIKPLLERLPKARGGARRSAKEKRSPIDALSRNGQLLLLALCRVDKAFAVEKEDDPLNSLLLDHYDDLRAELRSSASSVAEFQLLKKTHCGLLKKLKLKKERSIERIEVKQWPQPFRGEYERFLKLATGEVSPDKTLSESAVKYEFSLEVYSPDTITTITNTMAQVMSRIRHKGKLSVVDLIKLRRIRVQTPEGKKAEDRNSYVDCVRESERAKSTKRKRAGYDSDLFKHFLLAIRAIAARNEYGHLIRPFNNVYKAKVDKKGRRSRKADKKGGISRRWLDKELERLGAEFDRIVSRQLFKRGPGRSGEDADRFMRLCLFYVQILTMRLIGYRQQAIRKCVLDDNIRFLRDGAVILHFDRNKVKNKRVLHMEIRPLEGGTHERLRKVLILYYKKIWPYLEQRGGSKLQRHFFAHFDGNTEFFRKFKDAMDYAGFFKKCVRQFINVQDLETNMQDAIHPHFIRGVCTDWMVLDLGMTIAEAATVLGDTEQVVAREYLDRNRVYDATPAFNRINAARLGEGQQKAPQIVV